VACVTGEAEGDECQRTVAGALVDLAAAPGIPAACGACIEFAARHARSEDAGGRSFCEIASPESGSSSVTLSTADEELEPAVRIWCGCEPSLEIRADFGLGDDSFRVSIDGLDVCVHQAGTTKVCPLGDLPPGEHVVRVIAVPAPNPFAGFEVRLRGGARLFEGGFTRLGFLNINTGVLSDEFDIVVP
jgi:hypothetical protein